MPRRWLLFWIFLLPCWTFAQRCISHGISLPTRDTLYALVVFAEIDYSTGDCPGSFSDAGFPDDWPAQGVPQRAHFWFDPNPEPPHHGIVTRFYEIASFGSYIILGDYWPERISIPCSEAQPGSWMVNPVLTRIQPDSVLLTANGLGHAQLDRWTVTEAGLPKLKVPDGKLDLIYIVWKNNRYLHGLNTNPNAGYGVTAYQGIPFAGFMGLNNMSSFNNAFGEHQGVHTTVAEHLHGIFGGNHWHSAGGRGVHTTMALGRNYGLTAQLLSPMLSPCAWDRWMMNWKPTGRCHDIAALDSNGLEINTDFPDTLRGSIRIWLRDFLTSGDAVRIRLPMHREPGKKVKNQYLWLEYRRLEAFSDQWIEPQLSCARRLHDSLPKGTPGIYAYYQIGKDQRCGGSEIHSAGVASPNGLAGFLIPVSAEGRFDLAYRHDLIQPSRPGECVWDNAALPVDYMRSTPNPFTGYHDLWEITDHNRDGKLYSGDVLQTGLAEVLYDSVIYNYRAGGDGWDAFSFTNGQTEFSLSTNPAPVPIYTLTTDYENKKVFWPPADYENRIITLNGIRIRLIREGFAPDGSPAMQIQINWDDFQIRNRVRWSGNIIFSGQYGPQVLHLNKRAQLILAKGSSPVMPNGIPQPDGSFDFSEPTVFRVDSAMTLHLEAKSQIIIEKNCTLHIASGARLIQEKDARIRVRKGGMYIHEGRLIKP